MTIISHDAPSAWACQPDDVHTLADFKRFLAMPGARVRAVAFAWFDEETNCYNFVQPSTRIATRRAIESVSPSFVVFEGGSRLSFGKASEWSFDAFNALATHADGVSLIRYELEFDL